MNSFLLEKLLFAIVGLSLIALMLVYAQSYVAEVHMAKAIPLAIIYSSSVLAFAILKKRT